MCETFRVGILNEMLLRFVLLYAINELHIEYFRLDLLRVQEFLHPPPPSPVAKALRKTKIVIMGRCFCTITDQNSWGAR